MAGMHNDRRSLTYRPSSSDPSSMASSVSSVSSTVVSASTSEQPDATSTDVDEGDPHKVPTSQEQIAKAQEKIASDLKTWQDKFAQAADKGTEDLEERVKEITDRQVEKQARGVGKALIIQLEEESKTQIEKVKAKIIKLASALPQDADQEKLSSAEDDISKAVKDAGMAIREKAQALRTWRQKYDDETQELVSAASKSTLDVLNGISDLGLQEIGMRWAWMDGVTYKDWSKYHEVRKNFEEWTSEVGAVAKEHPGVQNAQEAGREIESSGMAVAETTAKELTRLKDVGKWKIQVSDVSDDFSTKYIPPRAAKVGQKVMENVQSASEQVVGTTQGDAESVSSKAKDAVANAASTASSAVAGTEPGLVEKAGSKFSEASSSASKGVTAGTPAPVYESVASAASDKIASASAAVSDAVPSSSTLVDDNASNGASSVETGVSSAASKASKKVFGGAMAQKVGEQKPILDDVVDDDATYSEKLQSMVYQAGEQYADVTNAVSEAMFKPTSTQGSVESMTSLASEQYSSALAAASSALYGTRKGNVESMTSVASGKYAEAVAA